MRLVTSLIVVIILSNYRISINISCEKFSRVKFSCYKIFTCVLKRRKIFNSELRNFINSIRPFSRPFCIQETQNDKQQN